MSSSNANGISVNYTYDELNRLSTVVDNRLAAGQNTTTYTYDPASNLATVTYPNTLQSTFNYDDLNRLKSLNGTKASYSYTLAPTGNRLSATESSGRAVNWNYDGIYWLTNETISLDPHSKNGSVGYGLDPVGNRLSQTSTSSGIPTGTFGYDANDRLSTETYDNNGNTLTSGGKTFAYNFENRLKSMNSGAVTLQYDGDGNRVAKTVNGVTTRYLVDDLNPSGYAQVVEELVGTTVQRTYAYGLQRINENQLVSSVWTPSFYGYDGGGTVRLLTDTTGAVTDTYDFDAWGELVNSTGTTPNNYLYRGEQYDPDLGIYYLRARWYNPPTGRFLLRDPADGSQFVPESFHKYSYGAVDPVNRIDPSGKNTATEYTLLLGGFSIPGTAATTATATLVIACSAGYIVSGINMALAVALGWEVYDIESPAPCIVTFKTRVASGGTVGKPRPAPKTKPPGDCTPWELAELEKIKNAACAPAKGSCEPTDPCAVINTKIIAKWACIGARQAIMIRCFRNGDVGHQAAVSQLVTEIVKCQAFQKTCKP